MIRIANEIRDLLKANNDRIYYGTTVHRVMDRFDIKSCDKCHKFGYYHAECTSIASCGYCMDESHISEHCQIRKDIMSYQKLSVPIVKKQRKRLKVTLVITKNVQHILMFKREQGQTYCITIQKTDQGGTAKELYSDSRGHEYQHCMCH